MVKYDDPYRDPTLNNKDHRIELTNYSNLGGDPALFINASTKVRTSFGVESPGESNGTIWRASRAFSKSGISLKRSGHSVSTWEMKSFLNSGFVHWLFSCLAEFITSLIDELFVPVVVNFLKDRMIS